MWSRFNGFTLMVSPFLQGKQGHTSCPVCCTCNKATDLNERQDALGIMWYPSFIPGVGRQIMHVCNKSSRGDQTLAKWPRELFVLFEVFLGDKGWSVDFCHFWNISWICLSLSMEVTPPWSFEERALILQEAHILEQNSCSPKGEEPNPQAAHRGEIRRQEEGFQMSS